MKITSALLPALFAGFSSLSPALGATYSLTDSVIGSQFFNFFTWENIADPTHGRVNYLDQATSKSQNLTFASSDTFIMRADFKNTLSASGPGRNSVRIKSQKTFSTHVAVFNLRHMPQGCGTWPAIWETQEAGWPAGGEVDILEGVNDQGPNAATLHTLPGCTMPASRSETGNPTQTDCNTAVNGNAGCGVKFPTATSYGPTLNSVGGGWYAIERTPQFIKVWFWARNAGSVPSDVKNGASKATTDAWARCYFLSQPNNVLTLSILQGTPAAFFPNNSCNIPQFFSAHNIIINLSLCGDWAGTVYSASGCPSTCVDFVNNNPGSFSNAYFDFASIRIYQ